MTNHVSRRQFLQMAGGLFAGSMLPTVNTVLAQDDDWRNLLPYYARSTRSNIVTVDGQRALLSAKLYPGTYVRDAVFWGPLGLDDPELGYECWRWFAENPLEDGQIPTAVPLFPADEGKLLPQDDEGSMLFIIAADWLRQAGYTVDLRVVNKALAWVQAHIVDDLYISPAGPFRYWADTVSPDEPEAIAHNQGLYCLTLRAAKNLGIEAVSDQDIYLAQAAYRSFYDVMGRTFQLGKFSQFAQAQDISALLPEFISRLLYDEKILPDTAVLSHVDHALDTCAVALPNGNLAGIKVIAAEDGSFLPSAWYHAPDLNQPGDYQNGGYWPMYAIVALALAYQISGYDRYADAIGQLVTHELSADHHSKEIMRLVPGHVGEWDPARMDYTWNVLISTACYWAGLA